MSMFKLAFGTRRTAVLITEAFTIKHFRIAPLAIRANDSKKGSGKPHTLHTLVVLGCCQ